MADESLCSLHVTSRQAVALAPAIVDGSSELLGVLPADRARLSTVVAEVIDAVLKNAYEPDEDIDLKVEVFRAPGKISLVLRDKGAPLDFGTGYPPRVADLIRLGFADDLAFVNEGRDGNRTQIGKRLTYARVSEDQQFISETEADTTPAPTIGEDGQVVVDIRPMTPDDVVGVARLFYRTYGYTVAYAPVVYEPDRLAELVADGQHFATVAVAPDGRIVGHLASQIQDQDAITGKIGLLAVDPLYRRHNLAMMIGFAHAGRLIERGIVGQFTEAVTVHLGSQKAALRAGGHEVGVMLAAQSSDLRFKGFDENDRSRKAAILFYGSFGNTPEREVFAPPTYGAVIRRIYEECAIPRTVRAEHLRLPDVPDVATRFRLNLGHETSVAWVFVQSYGNDFLASLQAQLEQLRLNRFAQLFVVLPMADPLTAHFGAGLQEIGLSFSGVYPEYDKGDVLVLQSLNNVELRPEEIQVASEMGQFLLDFVLQDYREVVNRAAQRNRSRAAMARIYEALD
jgi:serine/threonine-protein kinase RsbW